jgi:thiosulfate dehydrogenase
MDRPVAGAMICVFVATLTYLAHKGSTGKVEPVREVVASRVSARTATPPAPAAAATPSPFPVTATASKPDEWTVPDVDKLPDDAWGRIVRLGRELTVATYAHLGPDVADPSMRFTGSNMSCQNCHLVAGTKKFGLPFVGVFADFPQYRSREGEVGTLEDRINGCMTRSLNGRPLPVDSEEMKAFVAYIKFLSTGRPVGTKTPGRGSGKMPELTRAADPAAGTHVYAETCAACHGADGEGKRAGDGKGYEFPPLWGPDSFNDGAGMARLISSATFIHSNMPNGTTADQPVLTPEQAWDVAAYMVSMKRPQKGALNKDFPVGTEKPVDTGYGPYIDGFSQDQHKYGPFQAIRDRLKAIKADANSGEGQPTDARPPASDRTGG